ncbi:unnamed protein product [Symbiodinium sp. CCMP2592]|nr:unnamed protein product [Symbiodinium sp. CCMP2592]
MSEADGASPSSEETSFTPVVDEPSTNPQAAKAKQNGKKVRNTKRSAKPQAAEANTEAKEVPATAVVPEDTVPAEAEATPEAAAPVKEAPAPAKGKAQGSAECAGQGLPATVEQTAAAPEDEQKEVAAAGPKEMEQPREDVSTSAEGDKGKAEVEAGDLNKVAAAGPDETEHPREDVSASAEGDKCKEEDSLVEAAGRGDLEKVKEFLANSSDPNELENGKETSSFAPEPAAFRRLAQEKGLLAPPDGKLPGTTALIAAVVSGHSHVAWELLRSRADLDARDSDGLTALSAASCSTACDIHMWFLLHRAASQTQKSINQSSSSEADIQESDFRKRFVNNFCRRFLWDRNHQEEETRILRMLVTLLLGQGQDCTEMVRGLLKKAGLPCSPQHRQVDDWLME